MCGKGLMFSLLSVRAEDGCGAVVPPSRETIRPERAGQNVREAIVRQRAGRTRPLVAVGTVIGFRGDRAGVEQNVEQRPAPYCTQLR
ncbi:hypothetical protein GCM10009679_42030 [Saccharothrix algeriensis]